MSNDDKISSRLNDVMASILCPVAGCWGLHGAHCDYYYDHDAEAHVLEVWPVGIEEPEQHEDLGNLVVPPPKQWERSPSSWLVRRTVES